MIALHTTHQVSQQPTEVDRTQECDAHNGTESNLTHQHPHFFFFRLFSLFHNLFILGVYFVAVGGLEPPTVYLPLELQTRLLYQLSYTAI